MRQDVIDNGGVCPWAAEETADTVDGAEDVRVITGFCNWYGLSASKCLPETCTYNREEE